MFRSSAAVAAISAILALSAASVQAQPRQLQVGQLTCSLSASVGLIVGSQRNVNCIFRGAPGEPEEGYTGTMTRVGGSRRTVALQPVSIQGQVGLDIGAGISELDLHPAP